MFSAQTTPQHRQDERPEWKGARPHRFFSRLACEHAIMGAVLALCEALPQTMPRRTLELVALRVSAQLECLYVWQGHCQIALDAELTIAEIAAVAHGPAAFGAPPDAAVLQGVDDLLGYERMSAATRTALGDAELAVTVATATYRLVSWLMDGIEPEPGVPPVAGIETPARASASHLELRRTGGGQPEAA